jgi:cyclase
VVGVDSLEADGDYRVYRLTGDPNKTADTGRRTIDWIREAQDRGAGEFVLNCMNRDGVRKGYDRAQLAAIRTHCNVPLVASGGAGGARHFLEVFRETGVDGALAASVFHSGELPIDTLKRYLRDNGVDVRPSEALPA